MKTSNIVWIVILIIVVIGGLYWWASSSMQPAPQTATETPTETSSQSVSNPVLSYTTSTTSVGTYLVSSNSMMTLYQYSKDTSGVSNCTGTCATTWIPYTVSTSTSLSATSQNIVTGQIGTITRTNGTMQVTYNGMPLYFYSKDVNPGDMKGNNFGGLWSVVKP